MSRCPRHTWSFIASLMGIALTGALVAAPSDDKPRAPGRRIDARPAREQDETTINRAADRVGKEREDFRARAGRDGDLRIVVSNGRPAYACRPPRFAQKAAARAGSPRPPRAAAVAPSNVGTDTSAYVNDAPFPLDQTFALHTRPGAARILYLDFHGFTVHATDWNASNHASDDIVVPPFDVDGDPASYGDKEHAAIQEIWRRVAEDFAPFDVDVTTEDPGAANLLYDGPGDDHWGMRMVCGGRAVDVLGPTGDGVIGVAYLDSFRSGFSFDSDGNPGTDTPAFTFAADITDYEPVSYAAEIASTASHEFGHTVGLSHDGDSNHEYYPGYAGWAPIMGSGDPLDVLQWSKGEYSRANNKEDDLALIAAHYLPYLAPDHGTAPAGAIPLASGDTAGGVILRSDDTAWHKIQAGVGPISVTGSVASPDFGNLKLKLSLVDLRGNTLASSPVGSAMSAALTAQISSPGTYYIVVDGTSYLTPSTGYSDYDSVGRYSLTGAWSARPGNTNPVADLSGSQPLLGLAPLSVAFSSLASGDADGIIEGYLWDFGDGSPASTLANPTHAYAAVGDYTVALTVTDNDGATATTSATVSVVNLPPGARTLAVAKIVGTWRRIDRASQQATCTVLVRDDLGHPVANATVHVMTTGLVSDRLSATTDRSGRATFRSSVVPTWSPQAGTVQRGGVDFVVISVICPGFYYNPAANKAGTLVLRR